MNVSQEAYGILIGRIDKLWSVFESKRQIS